MLSEKAQRTGKSTREFSLPSRGETLQIEVIRLPKGAVPCVHDHFDSRPLEAICPEAFKGARKHQLKNEKVSILVDISYLCLLHGSAAVT